MTAERRKLRIYVDDDGLALLRALRFPCLEHLVENPRPTELGLAIAGSRRDFDSLAGWVAGEANHQREAGSANADILDDICDQLESVLA
jgi:hypothetical protein